MTAADVTCERERKLLDPFSLPASACPHLLRYVAPYVHICALRVGHGHSLDPVKLLGRARKEERLGRRHFYELIPLLNHAAVVVVD